MPDFSGEGPQKVPFEGRDKIMLLGKSLTLGKIFKNLHLNYAKFEKLLRKFQKMTIFEKISTFERELRYKRIFVAWKDG